MTQPEQTAKIPGPLVLLVGLGIFVLWAGLLILVLALLLSGDPVIPLMQSIVPANLEGAMRTAFITQIVGSVLTLVVLFLLGNVVLVGYLAGAHGVAMTAAIWLARAGMAILVLQLVTGGAMPFAIGGVVAVLPILFVQLPMVLVTLGLLICAERGLVRLRNQA